MSRMYTVTFDAVAVTAAQDLFNVAPADDKIVVIHGLVLSNVGGTADAGDAQEELLRLLITRGYTSDGTGGTSPTPVPMAAGDSAAAFTARVNDATTLASGGTAVNPFADGWNVRIPYQTFFTPETRPVCTQGQSRIVVRLVAAPAESVSVSGTLFVEEIG